MKQRSVSETLDVVRAKSLNAFVLFMKKVFLTTFQYIVSLIKIIIDLLSLFCGKGGNESIVSKIPSSWIKATKSTQSYGQHSLELFTR